MKNNASRQTLPTYAFDYQNTNLFFNAVRSRSSYNLGTLIAFDVHLCVVNITQV